MNVHVLWAFLIGLALTAYTIFDGFNLGVGVLLPLVPDRQRRAQALDLVAPLWDGSGMWLVLALIGLFVGFPVAYSILLPAFCLPLILMLTGLLLRGISLEMSYIQPRMFDFWTALFSLGSWLAAGCQGLLAGALFADIKVEHLHFAGRATDVFTPFTLLTALALPLLYALMGAAWLHCKTTGELQAQMRRLAHRLGLLTMAGLTVLALAQQHDQANLAGVVVLRYLALGAPLLASADLREHEERKPFLWLQVMTGLTVIASLLSLWPYIIPDSLTLRLAAAATPEWTRLLLPYLAMAVIFCCILYSYCVFRGKIDGTYQGKRQHCFAATTRPLQEPAPLVPQPIPLQLSWRWSLVVFLGSILLFFLVIGSFGDEAALVSLVVLVGSFIGAWLHYDHPQAMTRSPP